MKKNVLSRQLLIHSFWVQFQLKHFTRILYNFHTEKSLFHLLNLKRISISHWSKYRCFFYRNDYYLTKRDCNQNLQHGHELIVILICLSSSPVNNFQYMNSVTFHTSMLIVAKISSHENFEK